MAADNGNLNVANFVDSAAPGRPCLVHQGDTLTYGAVGAQAARLRRMLAAQGIGRGDRVALLLPNSPGFVFAYLAILGLGAVAVCINPLLAEEEIAFILSDSGARAAFTGEAAPAVLEQRGILRLTPDAPGSEQLAPAAVDASHPAVIVYSSGTTGRPKGVVLSHGNVDFTARSKVRYMGVGTEDRLLLFLPLHHCFGQNAIMNAAFCAGACLVLHPRFDREAVLASLGADRVSMVFGVPTTFLSLEEHVGAADTSSVRYWFSAAAPLPREVEERWTRRMGLPIHQGYGQTECSPFATYNHAELLRPGTVGTAIDGVELRVVDPQDGRVLPAGEAGEVVLRGPNVMQGYWNRPDETARTIRDGWLHTGDIGRLDEDGYLSVEDRLSDLIIVGGRNVYPAEIENALYGHPSVAEAAVYGVADPFLGEEVWARLVLRPGCAEAPEEIEAHCRRSLAAYKVPAVIEFTGALPRNPTGKILKRELRAAASRPEAAPLSGRRTPEEAEAWVAGWLARRLGLRAGEIERDRPFAEYGLDSVLGVALARELAGHLGHALEPTLAWEAPTLAALMDRLAGADVLATRRAAPAVA